MEKHDLGKASFFVPSGISVLQKRLLKVPPAFILFLCLLLTAISVYFAFEKNQSEEKAQIDQISRHLVQSLRQRMNVYATTLVHTRSFIMANPNFTRDEFKTFISQMQIRRQYPGIQGIGYTVRIENKNLQQHLKSIRSQGFPDYHVWPEDPREEYFSILFLEPFDERNRRAFGFDMHTEEKRKWAMDQARDRFEPVMTEKVILVQETDVDQQNGFLLYVPVYQQGMPAETVEQRRKALAGYVYSPFRARDLFDEVLQEENKGQIQMAMSVYSGDEIRPDQLLYSPLGGSASLSESEINEQTRVEKVDLNGQRWTLVIRPLYGDLGPHSKIPWTILFFGTLVSVIIYWTFQQAVRASNSLQKSENQIRLIADALPVLIAYVDLQGHYIFYNRTYTEWMGPNPELFQWKSFEEHSKILSGTKISEDSTLEHPELGMRQVNRQLIPDIRRGHVVGMVIVITDLTEEITIREKIAEEQRITEIISDVGLKVTSELSLEKVAQSITDSATELTGAQFGVFYYTAQNVQGENLILSALSGMDPETFSQKPFSQYDRISKPTFGSDRVLRFEDLTKEKLEGLGPSAQAFGRDPMVRSYLAAPVKSKSGTLLGGLFFGHADPGVFSFRSEKLVEGIAAQAAVALDNAKLYTQAQQANRMKDEFLATLSHELRTPLNVIMGHAEILKEEAPSLGELDSSLDAIYRNAQTQNQIINDLLDISAIITGKMSFHPTKINAVDFVRTAIESVKLALETKQIQLVFKHDLEKLEIVGDSIRLQQVIWNLLSNAAKFTPRGGKIEVVLRLEHSKCMICVSDNGAGIDSKFLPFVFDRFRQEDSSFSRSYGGLGLGLSITRQLVEMHGGTIKVNSEGKGQGTTFVVTLPVQAVHNSVENHNNQKLSFDSQSELAQAVKENLEGVRVLVLDDEIDARELVAQILKKVGAEPKLAANSQEALEYLRKNKFDVIISDLGMPEEDGLQFIRKWREYEQQTGEFTPAVVLTAYAQEEEKKRALSAGYQLHLTKPLQSQKLIRSILKLVEF